MNKNGIGIIGGILVIVLIVWLVGGNTLSCHESFWDKNKQVIEVKHN